MTEQNASSPSLEPTAHAPSRAGEPPLVVDLDGTLIYSDMLWESLMLFLRLHFLQAWRLPFWLLRGKAGFKHALAEWVQPDPATLPYDRVLVQEIAAQRRAGRVIVLATGSQRLLAERIALHLQTIDHVYATDSDVNFTSANKASGLVQRYGNGGFDYIGNARVDIPVWHVARGAYSVGSRPFRLPDGRATERIGDERRPMLPALVKAMRPRQWLKNLLVFVPMLAGHALDASHLLQSLLAFLVFSMCASSAYLLNDALDAPDDRLHPTKCRRPIAAGHLPLSLALFASPLLAFGALALCLVFNPLLGGCWPSISSARWRTRSA
ncbi:UbiA family prenyltransferase [Pseudoduganella lutea]|nr:UbiA family prenyltransferase [Pseudoduganella lutea]